MDPAIFKAYDIRGIYGEQLTEEDAWKIGCAAARFLPSLIRGFDRGQATTQRLCVGHDMRKHSPALATALMKGIRSAGIGAVDIGMVDTPQVYFAINHLGTCGGIQVTASHNSAPYNGFKISGQNATPIGVDTGLTDIKHLALSLLHTKGNPTGRLETADLTDSYREHVLRFLNPKLRELRIAIDALNGMAGKMIPLLFGHLPVAIVPINFKHNGTFKHAPNPLVEAHLADLKQTVKEQHCHFGLCFDGDADRVMMVDEQGQTVGCDLMTALMVPYFLDKRPQTPVVYDLRSSRVVQEEILKYEGIPRRERVGHAYMKKALRDSHARFGGELSGHFYFSDNYNADSGMITFVHLLNIIGASPCTVSELIAPLRRYRSSGELNFQVENPQETMDMLAKTYRDGQLDNLDGITIGFKEWWFNCRPSNTEPLLRLMVEALDQDLLNNKLNDLKDRLGDPV
ncbi:phosphomannomutase/phosphoglucomutase [Planctomycetota bacterium]